MSALTDLTIAEARDGLRAKQFSARELATAGNAAVEKIAPLNAFVTTTPEMALEMAAAQLPHIAIKWPPAVVGRNTISAMESGVFWGYVGLIEGLIHRIRDERGEAMGVVATGGLAPLFAGASEMIDKVDPDLTLWGLRLIFRRNRNR